ncbi:hypothetical protein [Nocardia sp. NPDC060259]|uniref:hypothetical protein n=1 Tax=Nocardia sp. NPDC060259 TaxID=3347088 RepID=UPI0036528E92
MGGESRYEAYEADLWERLARLLPSAVAGENFRDCRATGSQEAGLWILIRQLIEHRVPISDRTRAEIEVLAEQWGERLARHDEIVSCEQDSDVEPSIRLLPDESSSPVDPGRLGITDSNLTGLLVVPWLECLRCGRVLDRVHVMEPWGDLRYLADYYTVRRHTAPDVEPEVFDGSDLHSAFELLLTCT